MTEYLVYIEQKGDPFTPKGPKAHIPALPGAAARGETIEEAQKNLREAVQTYLRLLREVGESVPRMSEGIRFVFQEVDSDTAPTDFDTIRPNEMETLFRWMAISRQELVDLVRDLPKDTLDWKPDGEGRSIAEILYRQAEADLWYTDRLKQWPETPLFRLAAARGVALERLRALDESEWEDVTVHDSQKWTPRKIIRRMLELERDQIDEIRALLAAKAEAESDEAAGK